MTAPDAKPQPCASHLAARDNGSVKRRLDWPGRGPTWLGVPALIVAVCGAVILLEVLPRQSLSRDLLEAGNFAIADTVRVDIAPGRGNPTVAGVHVSFPTADGRPLETPLIGYEYDAQGMTEGTQTPRPGTRYAAPLQVIYKPAAPRQALAMVDARQWTADRRTPRIGAGMLAGGLTLTLIATARLSHGARKRGLAWWRWYSEDPQITRTDR
jgi:hypothetical protein